MSKFEKRFISDAEKGLLTAFHGLKTLPIISRQTISIAIIVAARHGHNEFVNFILTNYPSQPSGKDSYVCSIGNALCEAAAYNRMAVVRNLLNCYPVLIGIDSVGLALREAAENGHRNICLAILEFKDIIPPKYITDALYFLPDLMIQPSCSFLSDDISYRINAKRAALPGPSDSSTPSCSSSCIDDSDSEEQDDDDRHSFGKRTCRRS